MNIEVNGQILEMLPMTPGQLKRRRETIGELLDKARDAETDTNQKIIEQFEFIHSVQAERYSRLGQVYPGLDDFMESLSIADLKEAWNVVWGNKPKNDQSPTDGSTTSSQS